MKELIISADKNSEGKRIDIFIKEKTGLTRSKAAFFIKKGHVKVNGKTVVKPSFTVSENDRVRIEFPVEENSGCLEKAPIQVELIYEDDWILCVNKPAGIPVHPSPGHKNDTLLNAFADRFRGFQGDEAKRPGVVHRLDKDVSGIVILSKEPSTAVFLREQFASREVEKEYFALVWGKFKENSLLINEKIGVNPLQRKKMMVKKDGRTAITRVERILARENFSFLKILPLTGRKHQIRVHLSHIGHPVVNDYTYGFKESMIGKFPPYLKEIIKNYNGIFLHSRCITFHHPALDKKMTFKAPFPRAFEELMKMENIWEKITF